MYKQLAEKACTIILTQTTYEHSQIHQREVNFVWQWQVNLAAGSCVKRCPSVLEGQTREKAHAHPCCFDRSLINSHRLESNLTAETSKQTILVKPFSSWLVSKRPGTTPAELYYRVQRAKVFTHPFPVTFCGKGLKLELNENSLPNFHRECEHFRIP